MLRWGFSKINIFVLDAVPSQQATDKDKSSKSSVFTRIIVTLIAGALIGN